METFHCKFIICNKGDSFAVIKRQKDEISFLSNAINVLVERHRQERGAPHCNHQNSIMWV